jgi:glutamate/tyrosine decarboxylase-like PLP-dependent enzyme
MSYRHPCDWSADEIKRVGYRVVDEIARYLSELPERPAFEPVPQEAIQQFELAPAPIEGADPDAIVDDVVSSAMRWPFGQGHPRFYAWVNSTPASMGVFAEALAAAMNPSCAGGNHAAVYIERQVIAWYREMLGLPSSWGGLLVSGGSMAALTALAAARHTRAGFDVRRNGIQHPSRPLVVYRSAESHTCHQKAVELLGIGNNNLRVIPCDRDGRMSVAAFEQAVREDLDHGCAPIALVASAGTVNTGAVDPLDRLAEVCGRYGIWLHVDAAYGGPAVLTTRYAHLRTLLPLADSITLDPHKWLFAPIEAGAVLVRQPQALRETFSLVPPYLRSNATASEAVDPVFGLPWFSEYGFQQTRGFRALKCWMTMKQFGLRGYAEALEQCLSLADRLAAQVAAAPDFELLEPRGMSVVCFRYRPGPDVAPDEVDSLNRSLLQSLQLGGRYFLAGTMLDGRFYLRACIVNGRASEADIDGLIPALRKSFSVTLRPL